MTGDVFDEESSGGFLWTFPSYALIETLARGPDGLPDVTCRDVRPFAPTLRRTGEKCVTVFTDSDLADTVRERIAAARNTFRFELESPDALMGFLRLVQEEGYGRVAVDLTPKALMARVYSVEELLAGDG